MENTFDNFYNENPVHDMEVDYAYHINTGELSDIYNDDYINNLNDWD